MKPRFSYIAWFALCILASASCNFETTPILEPAPGGKGGEGGSAADGGSGGRSGAGGGSGTGGSAAGGGQGGGGASGGGSGGSGGAAGQSGTCTPNSFIECRGSNAIRCSDDGSAQVSQDCGVDGCNAPERRCNVCTPGAKFCSDDGTLASCGSNGLVSDMQACDQGCNRALTPAVCNSCAPGASFCLDTDTLRSCDSAGNAESDSDCPMGCMDSGSGSASCNACVPDQVLGCADAGNQLRCKADGTGTETLPCMNGCSGSGVCNVCVPNSKVCSSAFTLRTCSSDGTMYPSQVCSYGCSSLTGSPACNQCTPSAAECRANNLVQCKADGTIQSSTSCAYGCDSSATPDVCEPATLAPSNLPPTICTAPVGVDPLNVAPGGVRVIDTDTTTTAGSTIGCNQVVSQASGPQICVVRWSSITFGAGSTVTVTGSRALALVATINMSLSGVIDASANGPTGGPGSFTTGNSLGGSGTALPENGENTLANAGGGGGGYGTSGAQGGDAPGTCGSSPACADPGAGGQAQGLMTISPLLAGSRGGLNSSSASSQRQALPGGGGGGLQIVACNTLTINTGAVLDVGGGGGQGGRPGMVGGSSPTPGAGAGGGSGGALLIEAQTITFGAGVVLAANGGGGGGGATRIGGALADEFFSGEDGDDGPRSTTAANGGNPGGGTSLAGGKGGAGTAPTAGGTALDLASAAGGGGGAAGRIRINNTSGSLGSVILSASPSPSVGTVTFK